ncbi:response regulator [Eubacteriales bacterium OttesenSCG-928-G02]|nr:response regulator [Eubacteriales bacterium OttesenSCG-928-G02]
MKIKNISNKIIALTLTILFLMIIFFGIFYNIKIDENKLLFFLIFTLAVISNTFIILYFVISHAKQLKHSIDTVNLYLANAVDGHTDTKLQLNSYHEFTVLSDNINILLENMNNAIGVKNEFISRMNHEIRTPLNAIFGMTQICRNNLSNDKRNECADKIEESADELLNFLNEMLDFNGTESGKLILNNEHIFLKESLTEMITQLEEKFKKKGVSLFFNCSQVENNRIFVDEVRLKQAIKNLLLNAYSCSDENGSIELKIEEFSHINSYSEYVFTVIDNGKGYTPEELEKIFIPFSNTDNNPENNGIGSGLRMAVSHRIVKAMGGYFKVESQKNNGSSFSFYLKLKSSKSLQNAKKSVNKLTEYDFSHKRVLIVDDIDINREILTELLLDTGIEIYCADNGLEAVKAFIQSEEGYYDVILMDMQMPVMDGYSACEIIRKSARSDSSVVIIATTANVSKHDIDHILKCGMNDYIGKPIDTNILYKKIKDLTSSD